ncbi:DUF1707 SHOCT-like domain-containing protein [Actinomadura roseirufa]|uniref:DUF1707 SHOCT-like domain-containing protein n=1 Tax=Actinomadura roseirufa TaxID=2094049 RepID=UPI0010411CE9|nr:DUF1707 domain-containing protein [Actinomadura roseirufa]
MSGLEPERSDLRASHEEREHVVDQLRVAAGDGRLTPEDLDERLGLALTARTHGELAVLLRDLPVAAPAVVPPPVAQELLRLEARQGNVERTGAWVVPRRLEAEAHSANVVIDLTEAVISHPLLDVAVSVSAANVRLIVPADVEVDVGSVSVRHGNVKRHRVRRPPGTPVRLRVTVNGSVRHGNLVVRGPRRTFLEWLLRRPASSALTTRD